MSELAFLPTPGQPDAANSVAYDALPTDTYFTDAFIGKFSTTKIVQRLLGGRP